MPALTLLGNALLLVVVLALAHDLIRQQGKALGAVGAWLALVVLMLALVFDRFELEYVYASSARDLPLWLKVACLWGGEPGTLLLLATLLATLAYRYRHYREIATGLTALAVMLMLGCLRFNAFAPSAEIHADGLGLNAHLISPWMAVHPPAVLLSYALLWVPFGAALQGLRGGTSASWTAAVHGPLRLGWAMSSLGLASGMWWAFQDYTYGQFWHWDPVQTAVFAVWALATAQLHGGRRLSDTRRVPALLLWSSVLCAVCIPLALLIVRDATLASSHRYIGDTSRWLMLSLAVGQLLAALIAFSSGYRRRHSGKITPEFRQPRLLIMASVVFVFAAAAAAVSLAYSYLCAALECPRDFVPYRQSVMQWSGGEELQRLSHAFAQWEVDYFVVVRLLLPAMGAMLLLTGYAFARPFGRRALLATGVFAIVGIAVANWLHPLARLIDGSGVTTTHTTEVFYLLDMLLIWSLWPAMATLAWCIRALRLQGGLALRRAVPVGIVHLGAVMVVFGATVASTLDTSAQQILHLPEQYGDAVSLGKDLRVSVDAPERITADDGTAGGAALLALSEFRYHIIDDDSTQRRTNLLFRDPRALQSDAQVSGFRQRCMILDYRFSRALDRPGFMLHPVIDHGWLADWQLWMPAEPPPQEGESREVVLMARRFPMLSILWSGLALILMGTAMIVVSSTGRWIPRR